jgi:thiamine-phosphate pyrophosphorylase
MLGLAQETATRLYLVVEAGTAVANVAAVLGAADVAALLIAPADDAQLDVAAAKPLVELAQQNGVAALIEADAQLARTLRADGVHLPVSKDIIASYGEARDIVGGRFIVGADAGRSRDDAMTLGEANADYIAFGIPAFVEDRATARERQRELIAWWSEIFEVPCVALDVETLADAGELAKAGADFVALRLPSDATAQWAQDAVQALSVPERAA